MVIQRSVGTFDLCNFKNLVFQTFLRNVIDGMFYQPNVPTERDWRPLLFFYRPTFLWNVI